MGSVISARWDNEELSTNKDLQKNQIKDIIDLKRVTTNQTYFEFNQIYNKQCNGLAIPLSGILASLNLHHLEKNHILSETNPIKYYIGINMLMF